MMKKKLLYVIGMLSGTLWGVIAFALLTYINVVQMMAIHQPPLLQKYGIAFLIGAFSFFVLSLMLCFFSRPSRSQSRALGSSHFAHLEEIKSAGLVYTKQLVNANQSFLELGTYGKKVIGLDERRQESHTILVAPTGKRKTSGIIIPALLQEKGNRSLIINDIKMELIDKTAGALAEIMPVRLFCPTYPDRSLCYNPLACVQSMEDAEDLATCFIENTGGKSKEEFWNAAAKLLLIATILHIRETEPEAPFCRIADILTGGNLDAIKTLLLTSPSTLAKDVATTFLQSISLNDKLAGSVMTDISVRLLVLKNPSVRKVTACNEISFDISTPTALFLSIPLNDTERLRWLSSCLLMQMMTSFVKQAITSPGQRLTRGVGFYLDEFANIGIIPNFLRYITLVRSFGMSFLMAVQNFGQLIEVYGEHGKETILANANTEVVYPGCGLAETQYYSDKAGVTTQQTRSQSGNASMFTTTYTSESQSETQRRLLTSDEIRTMKLGTLLILCDNLHPFQVTNMTYIDRPELQKRRKTFQFLSRELPLPQPYVFPDQPAKDQNDTDQNDINKIIIQE